MRSPFPFVPLLLALALAAIGCGSSSSSVAGGGVGGSGVSKGPVSDFGSVFVTGIEWDTGTATIELGGTPGSESDLGLGMVLTVEGDLSTGGASGTARTISFDPDVEGPIRSISLDAAGVVATLDVLGTTVIAEDGATVFDDSSGPGYTFADLAIDDVIEVSGLVDQNGAVRATRIERKGAKILGTTRVELSGVVANLAGNQFELGPIPVTVTFDGSTDLTDLPGDMVAEGLRVDVHGTLTADDAVFANRIDDDDDSLSDQDNVEIEGVITSFTSLSNLQVAGQQVDASGAARVPTDPSLYRQGVRVEVEGNIRGGVLIARKLELRGFDTRISAEIASDTDVNPANGRIVLLGVVVETDEATQFEDDESGAPDDRLSLSDLRAGDYLEVRGVETDAGTLRAIRVERDDTDDVELRGFVGSVDPGAGRITILGVTVDTDANDTSFEDVSGGSLSQLQFFNQVMPGDLVKVRDRQDGDETVIDPYADDVEFETPEGGSPGLPPSFFPGVVPQQPEPSLAAMLDEVGAFDAPPPHDGLSGELLIDTGAPAGGLVYDGETDEPSELQEPGATELSITDAVRLFFARIQEVSRTDPGQVVESDPPEPTPGE